MAGDGSQLLSIPGAVITYLYNGGGPLLPSGTPSALSMDLPRSLQGKGTQSATITSTSAGDNQLTFSSAPKTLDANMQIRIHDAAFAHIEVVYVASSYLPDPTATVIPLANPVVNAGNTAASWEIFLSEGPESNAIRPNGVMLAAPVIVDTVSGNYYTATAFGGDGINTYHILAVANGLFNGTNEDRWQGKNGVGEMSSGGRSSTPVAASVATDTVIKATPGRLARVLVTATGTNPMQIFDNASGHTGTIIGALPASPTVGNVYDFQMPAANGITVLGNANNPGVTISWT
jgi:hypothetical protein